MQKNISRLGFVLAVFGISLGLVACEKDEDRRLAEAQACLDTATSSNVNSCVEKVDGMSSPEASLVRCSAHYVYQNFTGTRLANAFRDIKKSGGTSTMATAMAYMAFDSDTSADATHGHTATDAVRDCQASGVLGMVRLAVMTGLSTKLLKGGNAALLANPGSITPTQMQAALASFAGDPASVGTLAQTASTSYCGAGSSFASTDVCTNLSSAISAGTSTAVIGNRLICELKRTSSSPPCT